MKYNCNMCNYDTDKSANFNKQLLSDKHNEKYKQIQNQNNIQFKCDKCNANFTRNSSLKRHIEYNCNTNTINSGIITNINPDLIANRKILFNKYGIKTNNNKLCVNDVVNNIIKSKSPMIYLNKIPNKILIDSRYYLHENEIINILNNCRNKYAKEFINEYNKMNEINNIINIVNNDIDIDNNNNVKQNINDMNDTNNNNQIDLVGNSIFDMNKELILIAGKKINSIFDVTNNVKTIWMMGKDIAEILEYKDTKDAIKEHVSDMNKVNYKNLLFRGGNSPPLKGIQKNTVFINLNGFFELISNSKKKEAKQLQFWVNNEVLPSLYNNGSYSIQPTKIVYKSVYDDKTITEYDNKNVVYIAHVGTFNNEELFKFGLSKNVLRRDFDKHRKNFEYLNMIFIEETDNNITVEDLFKKQMNVLNLLRSCTINKKTQTELFTVSINFSIEKIKEIMHNIIISKPLPSIINANNKITLLEKENENSFELEKIKLKIKKEETKQIEKRIEEIKELNKQYELKYKLLELEMKYNKKRDPNIFFNNLN